jgi:hypothetical protein
MKPGRNDPCPCGSGKKYKKCCYLTGQNTEIQKLMQSLDIPDDYEDDDDDYENNDYEDDDYKEQELFITAINNIRRFFLDKKPHIKEYYKIRNMHGEIVNTMIQYHYDGKFKQQKDTNFVSDTEPEKTIHLLESSFDLDTRAGSQGFYDIWIYKMAPNRTCITDDFIRNHRYRKPDKIEFLHSMLDSKLGLFEVTGTDWEEGYAYLKDVFTGAEYTIVDIGLSGNRNNDDVYIYTRIISYHGINFNSGLNFLFEKTNSFIRNFIKSHKNDFKPNGEFLRFTELYNHYSQYPGKIKVITTKL